MFSRCQRVVQSSQNRKSRWSVRETVNVGSKHAWMYSDIRMLRLDHYVFGPTLSRSERLGDYAHQRVAVASAVTSGCKLSVAHRQRNPLCCAITRGCFKLECQLCINFASISTGPMHHPASTASPASHLVGPPPSSPPPRPSALTHPQPVPHCQSQRSSTPAPAPVNPMPPR
jgi:hypothetical protein